MKLPHICAAFLLLLPLGGCGLGDLFTSDTEDMRVRALVRDELDRAEAERGPRRRQYIDDRITETVAAQDTDNARLETVESQIGEIRTDLSIVSRKLEQRIDLGERQASRNASDSGSGSMDSAQLEELRDDVDAALGAVSKLSADLESREARDSARFERLELRTSRLDWPDVPGGRGLHLASYRSHDAALAGWEVMLTRFPELLAGQDPVLVEVETVAGLFVRLMIGTGEDQAWLVRVRDRIRDDGDYAMIMPIPGRSAPPAKGPKVRVPDAPKILIPGS